MPKPLPSLLVALALAACGPTSAPPSSGCPFDPARPQPASYGVAVADTVPMSDKVACMERAWADSKRQLTETWAEATASGRAVSPGIEAEVTEVLDRDIEGPDDQAKLERLSDAVSDARRLAELLRPG